MVQLTRENFDEEVTEAAGRVLVDFWGPGCGPCRAMESVLEAVAARHPEVKVAQLDVAEHPDIAWAFRPDAAAVSGRRACRGNRGRRSRLTSREALGCRVGSFLSE